MAGFFVCGDHVTLDPNQLILFLQSLPAETITLIQVLACAGTLLLFGRFFGLAGLYAYCTLAIIMANLQVLKATQYSFYTSPVALGTVVFSSIFLCHDIITELVGVRAARRCLFLSFTSLLCFALFMMVTLGFPLPPGHTSYEQIQGHMAALFTPIPALFLASIVAYVLSQLNDIWLFNRIHLATGERWLWLRTLVSMILSSLLDSAIFSFLAWRLFAPTPMDWDTLIFTYIFGTFLLRVLVAGLNLPLMYIAKRTFKL